MKKNVVLLNIYCKNILKYGKGKINRLDDRLGN
jgi:hypothetical protein